MSGTPVGTPGAGGMPNEWADSYEPGVKASIFSRAPATAPVAAQPPNSTASFLDNPVLKQLAQQAMQPSAQAPGVQAQPALPPALPMAAAMQAPQPQAGGLPIAQILQQIMAQQGGQLGGMDLLGQMGLTGQGIAPQAPPTPYGFG